MSFYTNDQACVSGRGQVAKAKSLHSISIKTEDHREGGYPLGKKMKKERNKELQREKKELHR